MATKKTQRETQIIEKKEDVGSLESLDPTLTKPETPASAEPEEIVIESKAAPAPEIVPDIPVADPTPEPKSEPKPQSPAQTTARSGIACPSCGSSACGIAGGMRHCNQCGHAWA